MRRILKYLLPIIVAAVFAGSADDSAAHIKDCHIGDISFEASFSQVSISQSESEPCLPRPVSFSNTVNVHSSARNTTNIQRSSSEFIKAGKIINASRLCLVQKITLIVYSSIFNPAQRLLSLGKLII